MSNAWKITIVRIERPPDVSPENFSASIRSWLSHHCVILANSESIALAGLGGTFDAEFDDPRDAYLFARRFVTQPISVRPHSRVSIVAIQTALRSWRGRRPMRRPILARWPAAA